MRIRLGGLTADVAMAFAARLLIRFAGLVPDAVDLRQTGRDIEALAGVLRRGPGGGALAAQIQDVLRRARRRRVLPPRSRAPSPRHKGGEMAPAHAEAQAQEQAQEQPAMDEGFDFGDFAFPADLFGGFSDDDVGRGGTR